MRRPPTENRALAAAALPLALAVTLASAPAPTSIWDWLLPDDEEEQGEEEQPSEEPTDGTEDDEEPEESPEPDPEDGDDDPEEDDGAEEDEEEEDGDEDDEEPDAVECEYRVGEEGLVEDEEQFLEAVEACQAAEEDGTLPEVAVDETDDCFTGSTRTSGLTADRLTMTGASYDGVVECSTDEGPQRYLRLSMSTADLVEGELWFEDAGTRMSLDLPELSMDGDVVLHVTEMNVRILGIPLTFTPDFPPPLLLPIMIVTDVDVSDPLAATDSMTIPGLNARHNPEQQ
ncbi:DNA primase [Nocardiopsis sp. HNM0947]|uniref:DNA primase n=1 Tax=Nocardiopsis coralli TaxID=2772213 RepID=A0ABR9PEA9_9ACTN|nr:DNA primase [Nocardiopsis coralli]MBE3002187.1 DNA primase [Nocardiopsis coralli]